MPVLNVAFLACDRNPQLFGRTLPSCIAAKTWAWRCRSWSPSDLAALVKAAPRQRFDVAVFHRPRYSLIWRSLLWWLQRHGTTLVADVDDLIFDPQLSRYSPGVVNEQMALPKVTRQFAEHAAALACFDRVSVSTEALAAHVRRCFPDVAVLVLPNAVHMSWRDAKRDCGASVIGLTFITILPRAAQP